MLKTRREFKRQHAVFVAVVGLCFSAISGAAAATKIVRVGDVAVSLEDGPMAERYGDRSREVVFDYPSGVIGKHSGIVYLIRIGDYSEQLKALRTAVERDMEAAANLQVGVKGPVPILKVYSWGDDTLLGQKAYFECFDFHDEVLGDGKNCIIRTQITPSVNVSIRTSGWAPTKESLSDALKSADAYLQSVIKVEAPQ